MNSSRTFRLAGRLSARIVLSLLIACATAQVARAQVPTTGEQKTAVILVNFQDLATQPISRAEAQSLVFGTVSDFYWEASYQKTFLSGDVLGWYTVPVNESTCNTTVFAQEADKMAAAAGVDLSRYSRLIYLMPHKACMDGGVNSGNETSPTRAWLTSNAPDARMIAHELAHNFGLLHSGSMDCGPNVMGEGCALNSFGDQADTMGSGFAVHFNATHKEQLGWLGATSGQPSIATVAASGNYLLAPYETAVAGTKALKIPRGVDPNTGAMAYYYLEYRQPIGFDAGLGAVGNLAKGVLVHTTSTTNSYLLDMTPDSYADTYNDMKDAALTVGRTYVDSVAGATITVKSADANGANVEVTLNGATPPPATCTRAAPTIGLSAPAAAVAAGSTVNYTVSLANRDSSGCGASTFNLARSIPTGWTGSLAAASLTLSPGSSASTTLSVTSPATAAAGNYGIGAGASSNVGSVHTASASATYSVAAAVGPLAGTVATDKVTYARGETVAMSARVTSNGAPVAGASVRFAVTAPNGRSTVLSATSGSDGYARTSMKLGKAKSVIGDYQLRADATSGAAAASATAAFSVR